MTTAENRQDFFDDDFFQKMLASMGTLVSWNKKKVDNSSSILCTMASAGTNKMVGHFGFDVIYRPFEDPTLKKTLSVMVKSKATYVDILNLLNMAASACGTAELAEVYSSFRWKTEFLYLDSREVNLVQHLSKEPRFADMVPTFYYALDDPGKEVFILAMEYLENVTHFNTAENAHEVWSTKDIQTALRTIARFHSVHLSEKGPILDFPWLVSFSSAKMADLKPLYKALLSHNRNSFDDLWTPQRASIIENVIDNSEKMWKRFEESPRTLIHNDFNPRNVCMRKALDGVPETRLCVYDWELATIHVPQYDVAEFLAFTLAPDVGPAVRQQFLRYYQEKLEKETGKIFDSERFLDAFNLACCDFAMNRLAMYSMLHTRSPFPFLPRVLHSNLGYLEHVISTGQLQMNPEC